MKPEQKEVEINGRRLPREEVDSFVSMWDIFTYHNHKTPVPVVKLLAYAYITRELPSEAVMKKHKIDGEQFAGNLRLYEHKLKEDQRITAQMRVADDARLLNSPLLSEEMWNIWHGDDQ